MVKVMFDQNLEQHWPNLESSVSSQRIGKHDEMRTTTAKSNKARVSSSGEETDGIMTKPISSLSMTTGYALCLRHKSLRRMLFATKT